MDTTEFAEGEYLTPELVRNSPTKLGVVLNEASGEDSNFGKKLVCLIELDKKKKKWTLNRDSIKNMQQLGTDSRYWVGKAVKFQVFTLKGKESIVGTPYEGPMTS